MSERPPWMSDPSISHISQDKLDFLNSLSANGHGKSQKEMMGYVMTVMKQAKEKQISFSPGEIQALIAAIKKYSTPEELAKMDEIMKKAPLK